MVSKAWNRERLIFASGAVYFILVLLLVSVLEWTFG